MQNRENDFLLCSELIETYNAMDEKTKPAFICSLLAFKENNEKAAVYLMRTDTTALLDLFRALNIADQILSIKLCKNMIKTEKSFMEKQKAIQFHYI